MQGEELRQKIKEMMVEELMLELTPAEISDTVPIFGGAGLGLDSRMPCSSSSDSKSISA